jgi:Cdc6-like AAA superfamily ATPase
MTIMELSIKQLDYKKLFLETNPFPYVGIPDETNIVYTNRKKEQKQIGNAIMGTARGTSSHMIIVGNYGNGKTSTLEYVKKEVSEQMPSALPIIISYPGESILELYSNLMYQIGLSRFEKIIWKYLEKTSKYSELQTKVLRGDVLLPEIIEHAKVRLYDSIQYNDFATSILHLILDETKFLAWKYLCGEPILHEQRKNIDVVSLIDTDEKALRAFLSLKKLLKETGIDVLCLLIDEMESIENLHVFKKQKILNSIRRLMDLNPEGLCLLMACTPEAWSSIISDYHAFSERIFRNVVLKPLDNTMLRQLIIDYLSKRRTHTSPPLSDIHPFEQDCLDDILMIAQGNVRRVLMICNVSIDYALEKNYDLISSKTLKEIFPEYYTDNNEVVF